jgi:uncharacterized protein
VAGFTALPKTDKIKLAVVVGGHPYDVPAFRDLFSSIPDVEPYIKDLDNWAVSAVFDQYDAFLFFNMHAWGITSVRKDMDQRVAQAFGRLGESQQGVFIMHHAILSFDESAVVSNVCNMDARNFTAPGHRFTAGAAVDQQIANPAHPITQGLQPWTLTTEGFAIGEPRPSSDVLLTTNCPDSSHALGWTHQLKNARVFCYIIGHDAEDWNHPSYYTVLSRGIRWVAQRI